MLEIGCVDRINSAEYHRMDFLETRQRLARRVALVCDGVPDLDVGSALNVGDKITNVARFELRLHQHLRRKHTDFLDLVAGVVAHQLDGVIGFHGPRNNAHVADDAAINIEY